MLGHQLIENPDKTDRDLATIKNHCSNILGITEVHLAAKFKMSSIDIPYVLINENVDVFKTPYAHLYLSVLFFVLGEKEFTTLCESYLPKTEATDFVVAISTYWPNIRGDIEFELPTIHQLIIAANAEQDDLFFLNFISNSSLHSRYILTVLLIKNLILSSHSLITKLFGQLDKSNREFIILLAIQNPTHQMAKLIFDSLAPNEFVDEISQEIKRIIARNEITEKEDTLLSFWMNDYSQHMPNIFSKLTDHDYSNLISLLIKKERPTLALLVKNTCEYFYRDDQLNKLRLIFFALITAEKLNFAALAYLIKTYPVLLSSTDIENNRLPLVAFLEAHAMHDDARIRSLINIIIPLGPSQLYQDYFMSLLHIHHPLNYMDTLIYHLGTAQKLKQAFADRPCDTDDLSFLNETALLACISKFLLSHDTCFPDLSSALCFNLIKLNDPDYLKQNAQSFLSAAEKGTDEIIKKMVKGFFKAFLERKLKTNDYQSLVNAPMVNTTSSMASTSATFSSNAHIMFGNSQTRKRATKGKEPVAKKRPR